MSAGSNQLGLERIHVVGVNGETWLAGDSCIPQPHEGLASLVEVVHGIQGLALGTQSLIQGLFGSIIGLITPVFVFALGAFSPVLEVGSFSLSGTPGLLLCRRAVEEGRCCEPYCETEDAYCPVGPASPEMSSVGDGP